MDKTIVQVEISELVLPKRGPADDREDINLFRFSFNYPSENVSGIESAKTVKVTEPIPTDWGSEFDKALLFKTALRGKSRLSVEASCVDKETEGEKFFKGFFKSLFGAVLGVWTGGFGSAYVGAITSTVGTSLLDMVEDEDDVDIVGVGELVIDSETLDHVQEITIPLVVKTPVTKKTRIRNHRTRRWEREQTVLIPAGPNGHVKLKLTKMA